MRGCVNHEGERGFCPSLLLGVGEGIPKSKSMLREMRLTNSRVMGGVSNKLIFFLTCTFLLRCNLHTVKFTL